MTKTILILADTHCGHRAGLTPRDWQDTSRGNSKWYPQQVKMWDWFCKKKEEIGKVDICVVNGDAIDGKGYRSGGTEQIEADRIEQAKMVNDVLREVKAKEYYIVFGTPYHTGQDEDLEKTIGEDLNIVKYSSHLFLKVNDTLFDIKHKIGGAGLPHTRFNSIGKAQLWNMVWAERNGQKKADVLIRSHLHYFKYAGDSDCLGIVSPALQGFGSKFGERQCEGIIDIGFVYFKVDKNGYDWQYRLMKYETIQKNNVITTRLK